jgi:tetratricopeptide (TPR) repeat protein
MWMFLLLASAPHGALQQAQALEAADDVAAAVAVLERAVAADPSWAMARLELGRLALKRGVRTDAGFEHLDIARSLAPENPRVHYLFALAADERGARRVARHALEVALALRSDYADAQFRLGGLAFADGEFAQAVTAWSAYLDQHPEATGTQLQLAVALERSGRAADAEQALRGLLKVPAARVIAGRRLAELLERRGRAGEAAQVRQSVEPPRRELRPLQPSQR